MITIWRIILLLLCLAAAPAMAVAAGLDIGILPAPDAQGKWGYIDALSGKTLIAPQFHEAGFFYDGVAIVTYAYPDKAYDVQLVDSVTGTTTAASAIPTAQGLISRDGRKIVLADRLERASAGMSSQGAYIPRLFLARRGNDESAVFHADRGQIVPPGKYQDIRFTPEGAVYCDGVYYAPDGKRHDPPRGCEITSLEPETGTFQVQEKKEQRAFEGVMRQDGSLIVPVKYDEIQAVPEAGIWLASRGDASVMVWAVTAFLTGTTPEIKEDEDILTVDVYDASGKRLRSFRARYHPTVSGTTYAYKSKGVDYRVDARTGEVIPAKEKKLPADPASGFRPFKEGEKYGIKNAAGAVSVPPIYEEVESLGGGLFAATREKAKAVFHDNWGVIDGDGKEIIPFVYNSISRSDYPTEETGPLKCGKNEVGYWLVGRDGRFITPEYKPYNGDFYFNAVGLAVIWRNHKHGVIDYAGKEVLPCAYDTVFDELRMNEDKKSRNKNKEKWDKPESSEDAARKTPLTVKDALFRVKRGDLWGLYDGTGKELIPIKYGFIRDIEASDRKQGWIGVEDEKRQKNGAVNFRTGQTITPIYDSVRIYPGFFVAWKQGGKGKDVYIALDAKGGEMARYQRVEWFDDAQVLAVEQNGKYALLDKTGKQICPFRYDYVHAAAGPFVWGGMERKRALLNGKPFIYQGAGVAFSETDKVLVDGTGKEYRIK